ncbi:Flavin-containing monooxygenase FMO GS-OX-like 1 [Raphanus sativus]|nr:Flavin-containing monooxygenase FMO GS-OX-like 1 [Raphanus sativus]
MLTMKMVATAFWRCQEAVEGCKNPLGCAHRLLVTFTKPLQEVEVGQGGVFFSSGLFETEVVRVEPAEEKWRVTYRNSRGVSGEETFDAVVVCNGHFTEPRLAHIPGIDSWPGKQIHSHNYRIPVPFKDQVVVVIGSQSSGNDISKDIATMAKEVHVSSKAISSNSYVEYTGQKNLRIHPTIYRACEDGSVVFRNGRAVYADVIVHCTGYKYHFPFLETNGYVTVEDNRVGPLYKHVFPPALAPGISFIGLPFMGLQFFMFEMQSKWVASVLSGRVKLPSEDKMMEDAVAFYGKLEALGIPKRYTHFLTDPRGNPMLGTFNPHDAAVISQSDYFNGIAEHCGCPSIESWRERQYNVAIKKLFFGGDSYRDQWDDDQLIEEVYREFAKLNANQDLSS